MPTNIFSVFQCHFIINYIFQHVINSQALHRKSENRKKSFIGSATGLSWFCNTVTVVKQYDFHISKISKSLKFLFTYILDLLLGRRVRTLQRPRLSPRPPQSLRPTPKERPQTRRTQRNPITKFANRRRWRYRSQPDSGQRRRERSLYFSRLCLEICFNVIL